jgi:hypothetical protein
MVPLWKESPIFLRQWSEWREERDERAPKVNPMNVKRAVGRCHSRLHGRSATQAERSRPHQRCAVPGNPAQQPLPMLPPTPSTNPTNDGTMVATLPQRKALAPVAPSSWAPLPRPRQLGEASGIAILSAKAEPRATPPPPTRSCWQPPIISESFGLEKYRKKGYLADDTSFRPDHTPSVTILTPMRRLSPIGLAGSSFVRCQP